MRKKWNNIRELCMAIDEDDMLDSCAKHLKCLGYAPNIGYRSWIFKYKGTLVALFDSGNGHYDFHTAVTYLDVIEAAVTRFVEKIKYRKGAE